MLHCQLPMREKMATAILEPDSKLPEDTTAPIAGVISAIQEPALYGHAPTGPPASNKEVWSYYAYYAANNGIGCFQ